MWPLSARGGVILGAPYENNDSGSSISSSVVAKRKSSFEGDKSASYVIPDDATADILSTICWILRHVQCFGVGRQIWHKDCTLASIFDESHWGEEDDRRIWIEYYVSCILDFFHV